MSSSMSPSVIARFAGLLYLFVVIASSYSLFATSALIVSGDTAATAANIIAAEDQFRFAFAANLLAAAAYVAVVALLYALFRPVSPVLAVVASHFGLAGCAVSAVSMINLLAALSFLADAGVAAAFDAEEAQALARMCLRLGGFGNSISLVFFGFYCALLGALVVRSRFLPRALGVFLFLGGAAWLAYSFSGFLALPFAGDASSYLMGAGAFGEIVFTLWFALMGVDANRWREAAQA